MISQLQENQIREYLLSKKLSLDILMEVEDHFHNQIESLLNKGNLSFDVAFDKVKEVWNKDLKIVNYYNGTEISVFAKNVRDREINRILFKSIVLTFGLLLCFYLIIKATDKESFTDLFTYFIFILLGFPALHYFFYRKSFALSLMYKPVKINIFQNSNFLILFCGFLIIAVGRNFHNMAQRMFDFVENGSHVGLASFIVLGVFLWFYSIGFLFQIAFIQSLKKMKKFLINFKIQQS